MRLRGGMEVEDSSLLVAGHRASDLAKKHGTPLYIYNENFIVAQCEAITDALMEYPGQSRAFYASKAFPSAAIEQVVHRAGLGIDVASEGELRIAMMAGIAMKDVIAHGANKSDAYIDLAIKQGVSLFVIDNTSEILRLEHKAAQAGCDLSVLLRVNPGVEAETHKAVRTANTDSKFGIPLMAGLAKKAAVSILACEHLRLCGVHCHVGSQVFKMDVFDVAAGLLIGFMQELDALGAQANILNIGGGFGTWYTKGDTPMPMSESIQIIAKAVVAHSDRLERHMPLLMIEPGRAVVAESAVALYTIGVVKEIPGVNHYILTDGGLFENPRPLLYGSRYTAFLAERMGEKADRYYTVSGMSCEADTVIGRIKLPTTKVGELLAVPSSGAYQVAMAGNYQRTPKPCVILVRPGASAVIQRRQTYEDMLATECLPDFLS